MNTTTIRIYPTTKKELDRLMEKQMTVKKRMRAYTYAEFIDFLIQIYKEKK